MNKKTIFFLAIILFVFLVQPAAAETLSDISFKGVSNLSATVAHPDLGPWFFSQFIGYLLAAGVNLDIVYLLLVVPFIAFAIAFFRQVIGISTFGVYTPLLLSLSFILLGIYFGLAILLIVILVSYLLRNLIGQMNLLYIPRTSFLFSCIDLSFFLVIWFGLNFGSPVSISLAIFPMLMISTISEKFSSAQTEDGFHEAVKGVVQTIVVAIVSYYFVIWPSLANLIVGYPEVVFIPLFGSLLLGKFTGLRLMEFFRFRNLLKENIEEE